jgi:hypothetical protein
MEILGTDPSNELGQRLILPILGVYLFSVESVRLRTRFRPHLNLANPVNPVSSCKRAENSSESNSHFGRLIGLSWGKGYSAEVVKRLV